MCGICGILDYSDAGIERSRLRAMTDSMLHRGPDASGLWNDSTMHLGHRRLKIIDLSENASQPMQDSTGRYIISYNGEIYNYRDLRREVESSGIKFRSTSDTEVLIELFRMHGPSIFPRLNGIFAFAIWDRQEKQLTCVRDHMGVKPLYFTTHNGQFLFASEIKALIAGGLPAKPAQNSIAEFLVYGFVSGTNTLFDSVTELEPGTYLTIDGSGKSKHQMYFDLFNSNQPFDGDERSAVELVRQRLEDSVDRQMVSDVPVGSMSSGGVDSSVITAMSAQKLSGISTFCVKVPAKGYDETAFSRIVSDQYKTTHYELTSEFSTTINLFPTLIWLNDEPMLHANSVPIFEISRLARKHVTVLLSGEGADEIFGGYYRYARFQTIRKYSGMFPRFVLQLLKRSALAARRQGAISLVARLLDKNPQLQLVRARRLAERFSLHDLAPDLSFNETERSRYADRAWANANDPLSAILLFDQSTYLQTLLQRQDRMCMGTSIESRVPILDVDLVRLANSLPNRHKLRGDVTKWILRESTKDLLDPSINKRPKHAFGLPFAGLLRHYMTDDNRDMLLNGELVRNGVVARRGMQDMIQQVDQGTLLSPELVWHTINLELWWRLFITKTLEPDMQQLPAYQSA